MKAWTHRKWVAATAPSNPGIPTFDGSDADAYWSDANPLSSVLVAGYGVTVTVTSQVTGGALTVTVANPGDRSAVHRARRGSDRG